MRCARMYCSATPFNGEIYAAGEIFANNEFTRFRRRWKYLIDYSLILGGVDESNCLNSIEKYDPKTGLWTPFSSLPRMMCGSGMQVLDSVPLSLALLSRKRKALYVDAGLGSGILTGGISSGIASDIDVDADDIELLGTIESFGNGGQGGPANGTLSDNDIDSMGGYGDIHGL